MASMRLLLLAAVLSATALAGCSDDSATTEENLSVDCTDPKNSLDPLCTTPSDGKGAIRGVVVDSAVKPLAGAKVQVKVGEKLMKAETGTTGSFAFNDIPPGVYFVSATKPGYSSGQTSVEVKENEASSVAKILLEADPENRPYVVPYEFHGFFECSFSAGSVGLGAALCSIPNDTCVGPACTGNLTQDRFGVFYTLDKVPTWVQSEMVWTSTQQLGSSLDLLHSYDGNCDPFYCDFTASGTSPLMLASNEKDIQTAKWGENGTQLFVRAFASDTDQIPSPAGSVGFTFQQSFTIYTHVFYGYKPPADWRFSADSKVPPPQ